MNQNTTMSPLLHHLQQYAGKYVGCEPVYRDNTFQRYFRAYFEAWDGELVTVISSGIRTVDNGPTEEIACSVVPSQVMLASRLVDAVCEMIIARQRTIEVDCLIDNNGPFFEDSPMEGLLASGHPYLNLEFNVHTTDAGQVDLQVITLLPVTRDEINLVAEHGTDTLYAQWERDKPDHRDLYRRSPIHPAT